MHFILCEILKVYKTDQITYFKLYLWKVTN